MTTIKIRNAETTDSKSGTSLYGPDQWSLFDSSREMDYTTVDFSLYLETPSLELELDDDDYEYLFGIIY